MNDGKKDTRELAARYAAQGEPDGWFEEFYARAEGDVRRIYWADLETLPHLEAWLAAHPPRPGTAAVTVGCGLGDDAELLARRGCRVTAFDVAPSAIAMCRDRWPGSPVAYTVADLFAHPAAWSGAFDLVYECNTVQILQGESRAHAVARIAGLAAPGGRVLVSCRCRERGEGLDEFPVALDPDELAGFTRAGLVEESCTTYDDDQEPPVPHVFAVYRRPA